MVQKTQKKYLGLTADRWAVVLIIVGTVLTTAGFVLTFTTAPLVIGAATEQGAVIGGQFVQNKLLLSQKIFYFHVPVAITSFIAMFFLGYYGVRFLMTHDREYDTRARISAEIAMVFIVCVMISGEMWEGYEWGVWWTWEPRLTSYLILMLLVIAYFVLRAAVDDEERRATYASVFGIVAFIDAPISLMITRLIPSSVHPVVFRTDSGLPPDMLLPFLISLFGMLMIGYGMYRLRLRTAFLQERVDALKDRLEEDD